MTARTLTKDNADDPRWGDPFGYAATSRDRDTLTLVRDALAKNRARLAYMPIVLSGAQSRVAFYEGLIRVMDDGGRVIPAAQFMPVIEDTDLGREIDIVTLELAMKVLRTTANLRLSVNVSARSIGDGAWRRTLDTALRSGGHLGDRLIIEISEDSAMLLPEIVTRFMAEMQPLGVGFALDGFGAGLISFRHLKDFFFDLVKIDKGFVRNVARTSDSQVIVEALITIAKQFEMLTIADGVESRDDAAFLEQIGVECPEGYLFGTPRFEL